jgi:hypothetical protein
LIQNMSYQSYALQTQLGLQFYDTQNKKRCHLLYQFLLLGFCYYYGMGKK